MKQLNNKNKLLFINEISYYYNILLILTLYKIPFYLLNPLALKHS